MNIFDIFKASAIKRENEQLHALINEMGARDAVAVKKKIAEYEQALKKIISEKDAQNATLTGLNQQIQNKKNELIEIDDAILYESFALYKPRFKFLTSEEYKNKLDLCRSKQKQLIKDGLSVQANENWTVNNSRVEGRKMVNDMKKLLLRSFNNECDYCVDNVKFYNMEVSENRIEKSYDALTKLGRIMNASIAEEYKRLKYDELHLAFEYQQKKQEEKEEQKRIRAELREQQKLEQEIREARERIAKEKRHFQQAIKELEAKIEQAKTEDERRLIMEKLNEVTGQYAELEKEEKTIDYREQNAKAGYVYIISNIGAFGENVYKIGMTRRLEPMDRVDELGDASVPFAFDVHALIFSENAPALEAKIHEHFFKSRINMINNRKEFFKADINEIEKVIKNNYDKVVDIVKAPPAEQYRESLRLAALCTDKAPN